MSIVIRVISNAGRSRVEMKPDQTVQDLKTEIANRSGVDVKTLKVFTDQAMRKALGGRDTDSLTKVGLRNGDMLHVANQNVTMTNLPPPPKVFKPIEEKKDDDKEAEAKPAPVTDSYGRKIKVPEKVEDGVAKDSYGRVIKEIEKKVEKKDVKMIQTGNEKKIGEEEGEQFVKHQSFENFLIEMKKRCKDKHLPH